MVNDPQQAICPAWEGFTLQSDSWSIIRLCLAAILSTSPYLSMGLSEHPMERKAKTFYYRHFWFPRSFGTKWAVQQLLFYLCGETYLLQGWQEFCFLRLQGWNTSYFCSCIYQQTLTTTIMKTKTAKINSIISANTIFNLMWDEVRISRWL